MATELMALNYQDFNTFIDELNSMIKDGYSRVVSSNAYFDGKITMYYALVEVYDNLDENPHFQILDKLDSIDINLREIESSTSRIP